MAAVYREIEVKTDRRNHWIDLTTAVREAVAATGISTGICIVSSTHTTAGVTLNENADSDVGRDVFHKLENLIPRRDGYHHAEGNSDSHLKASLVGFSVQVPVSGGRPVLGTWQAVYFCEFDGPRHRRAGITIVGE